MEWWVDCGHWEIHTVRSNMWIGWSIQSFLLWVVVCHYWTATSDLGFMDELSVLYDALEIRICWIRQNVSQSLYSSISGLEPRIEAQFDHLLFLAYPPKCLHSKILCSHHDCGDWFCASLSAWASLAVFLCPLSMGHMYTNATHFFLHFSCILGVVSKHYHWLLCHWHQHLYHGHHNFEACFNSSHLEQYQKLWHLDSVTAREFYWVQYSVQ